MSVESHIEQHLNQQVIVKQSVSTGLFEAYQVVLSDNSKIFIKYQSHSNRQLIDEGEELILLGKTIHTPMVLASCEKCLILEWIDTIKNPNMQSQMGVALANLHQNHHQYFGFHIDNKIGQTPQLNAVGQNINNWSYFFWEYRLLYQIELAHQNKQIDQFEYQQLLKIKDKLPSLLGDKITPVLLHGDLWSGNVLSGENHPYFIDTASYYGHREIDFSLTFMFGGFDDNFYQSYNKAYPLDSGFDRRKPLYMLYHYLNHLNIFGRGYHGHVMDCVKTINN